MALLLYVMFSKPLTLLVNFTWSLPTSLFKCSAQSGQSLPAEVSPMPNRANQSSFISYRRHSWSHHAELVLFTTSLYWWFLAGLCFRVISKSFPVSSIVLHFICVFDFSLWTAVHCTSPCLVSFSRFQAIPPICPFDFWSSVPKCLQHHPISAICKLTACPCSLAWCQDPEWKLRLRLGSGWKPARTSLGRTSQLCNESHVYSLRKMFQAVLLSNYFL